MTTKTKQDLKIKLPKGKYVAAISGGVDSMVLLDLLRMLESVELVVAHFDHGIRSDSNMDAELVRKVSEKYGLTFVTKRVNLGKDTSEATAREERYKFLFNVKTKYDAESIITAHHSNDLIETAVFNLMRGTNRKGLSSLSSTQFIRRPLINVSKDDIYKYAKENDISWREDETNEDTKYKRNYIRHNLITRFGESDKEQFASTLNKIAKTNKELDYELTGFVGDNTDSKGQLNRHSFTMLPHKLAVEVMATWLRQNGVRNFDSKSLDRLTISAKTFKPGQKTDVSAEYTLDINKSNLALKLREC